jgi:hypothetical protein
VTSVKRINISVNIVSQNGLSKMFRNQMGEKLPSESTVLLYKLEGPKGFLNSLFPMNMSFVLEMTFVPVFVLACNVAKSAVPPDF